MAKGKKNNPPQVQKERIGKKVMYMGLLGARFKCSYCGARKRRAMVVEYESKLFCSHDCAHWFAANEKK